MPFENAIAQPVLGCDDPLDLRRDSLSNAVFESVEASMDAITEELRQWWDEPALLIRLCDYPWWKEATQHIRTS
ncbi:MAG: hypothetical protein O3A46_05960 [Candidatus Poribacteria bacterium]|nr:hypothetical protein [Candidatus Poribacteria bacterium]